MKASELIEELESLIAAHGDQDVTIDDGSNLLGIGEVDVSADETEDSFILWPE
jgi:hypothetical protein